MLRSYWPSVGRLPRRSASPTAYRQPPRRAAGAGAGLFGKGQSKGYSFSLTPNALSNKTRQHLRNESGDKAVQRSEAEAYGAVTQNTKHKTQA